MSLFSWLRFYLLSSVLSSSFLPFEINRVRVQYSAGYFGLPLPFLISFPLFLDRVLSGKEVFTAQLLMTHYDLYVLRAVVSCSYPVRLVLSLVCSYCSACLSIVVVYTLRASGIRRDRRGQACTQLAHQVTFVE